MKIGIVGTGSVGQNFARALLPHGHQIMLASRTPGSEKMQSLIRELGENAQAGTIIQTVAFAELIALALPWSGVPDAVKQGDWTDKIVIDMTNRFGGNSATSAAQDLAAMTGARVVKAFNTIGAEHYPNPVFDGIPATMFITGDDTEAKQLVTEITTQMGFDVVDAGGLAAAAHLESLAAFWVHLAMRGGFGRNIAFKLLRG